MSKNVCCELVSRVIFNVTLSTAHLNDAAIHTDRIRNVESRICMEVVFASRDRNRHAHGTERLPPDLQAGNSQIGQNRKI